VKEDSNGGEVCRLGGEEDRQRERCEEEVCTAVFWNDYDSMERKMFFEENTKFTDEARSLTAQ